MQARDRILLLQCQVTDWKRHKTFCRSQKLMDDTLENHAMSDPLLRKFNEGFPELLKQKFFGEAMRAAFYTALRLYRKPYMHDSHGFRLEFDFDPRPEKLCERFILRSATVLHHTEMAAIHNKAIVDQPHKPKVTAIDFTTSRINARDPAIGRVSPDFLRIPTLLFASQSDKDGGYSMDDRNVSLIPDLPTEVIGIMMRESRCEVVPPPEYDWVRALRERLRCGGVKPIERVRAREAAREAERKEWQKKWPGVGEAQLREKWKMNMGCRDRFDWSPGE